MKIQKTLLAIFIAASLASCVSTKVHKELQGQYDELSTEAGKLRKSNADYEVQVKEQQSRISKLESDMKKLVNDTVAMGEKLRDWHNRYDKLNKQYEYVLNNNSTLMAASAKANKELMDQLEILQSRLQGKEDSLRIREKRVNELEDAIARKDSAMNYLRNKIANALTGFEGKGLTIYTKNGQVYVSMENSLLFASGSYSVSKRGVEALENIAGVLAENKDINVLVEGHTDNDPYNGSGTIKDNWDLSVMRATSVVKILTGAAALSQDRVTAAGKGEFSPLVANDTSENKAKNRRTEIILSPDLSELAEILDAD
jgi:chemotaxis protein MotB